MGQGDRKGGTAGHKTGVLMPSCLSPCGAVGSTQVNAPRQAGAGTATRRAGLLQERTEL